MKIEDVGRSDLAEFTDVRLEVTSAGFRIPGSEHDLVQPAHVFFNGHRLFAMGVWPRSPFYNGSTVCWTADRTA